MLLKELVGRLPDILFGKINLYQDISGSCDERMITIFSMA